MVVAVPIMWVMKVRADGVVEVVAMRDPFVPAAGTVLVTTGVLGAPMRWRALRRIGASDGQLMLVYVITMNVVQVTVVHIVGMPLVLDGAVAAAPAVRVRMIRMRLTRHLPPPFSRGATDTRRRHLCRRDLRVGKRE